jgi:hypothetical protein
MKKQDLISEILELIEHGTEGLYWDFKREWHSLNADLLYDIICMANSPANRDCYIIIGIEDKTCNVVGAGENRKNQQNLTEVIRQKPKWAGGIMPEVYVQTIIISEKEIDVIIIKQSDNTPFYLVEDYKNLGEGKPILKGNIYTRKADSNESRNSTADLYDTELLWKRRFGLLYNPSQRGSHYLKDLDNWARVDGEPDKSGVRRSFFYYRPDPDYTIHFTTEPEEVENNNKITDINDCGRQFYYLFSFINVSYHTDFSGDKQIGLYYKEIPLFTGLLECVDKSRTQVIPPPFGLNPYYIKADFRYLMFEFVFAYCCGNYSSEAKTMILRVIPLYENDREYNEFMDYIKTKGYPKIMDSSMSGEAKCRSERIEIGQYNFSISLGDKGLEAKIVKNSAGMVVNFASSENKYRDGITEQLRLGKMLVEWLDDWRKNRT